jgi:amidohydrolase
MIGTRKGLMTAAVFTVAFSSGPAPAAADDLKVGTEDLKAGTEAAIRAVEEKVIRWRRDVHEHPELSNREVRTAKLVAEHLNSLGLDRVETGIAHTGVVGTLRGARPGPTIALRADMDALPVTEMTGLPFASKARGIHDGQEVGVMHACGHDAHVAILMGAAEVLAGVRERLPGTIRFIFQPAEEGAPKGEEGGAELMVKEGILGGANPPEAIFGLHVTPLPTGTLHVRPGPTLAASDWLGIRVEGRQTHGSTPWLGVDPITVAAQIVTALQTIPSRHLNVTKAPAVVSIGRIEGGNRGNIIPDVVTMEGTIRTFDPDMREDFLERIRRTAEGIAEIAGAKATVEIDGYAPVTNNSTELTEQVLPSLRWAAGEDKVHEFPRMMWAEDFAFYQQKIPGVYFFLGGNEPGVGAWKAPANHSPYFDVHEGALIVGVRAMVGLALDYLSRVVRAEDAGPHAAGPPRVR